ncbi:hypothetical protein M5Q10_11540, partial [Streptococcus gallolyticus]|nr:hypothetical protein [Streptococcus gallolyticus]
SSFLLLSFSIILPYLIVDLKLCNRTAGKINDSKDRDVINKKSKSADDSHKKPNKTKGFSL